MPMQKSDPILGSARGSAASVIAYARKVGAKRLSDVIEYVDEVFRLAPLCGMDPSVVIAQAWHETGGFSTFEYSRWWEERLNPAGLGVTGDKAQNEASPWFSSGKHAARAHIAHLLLYATGKVNKGGLSPKDDVRYDAYVDEYGNKAKATTIQGLENVWGIDNGYAQKLIDQGNKIFPSLPNAGSVTTPSTPPEPIPPKETPMATPVTIDYSSLPFKVTYDPIPLWQTNQRPGQKQTVEYINIHETDNYSAGANSVMHNTWLHNGAPGAADTQVSVHFFVDDKQAYQTIPLNEISWNAGCGGSCKGNIAAISIELCVNSDGNYEKAYDNVCRLVALLIKTLGLSKSAIKFHQDWSGKWCPTKILNAGRKQATIDRIWGYVTNTSPAQPIEEFAKPLPVVVNGKNWDGKKDVTVDGVGYHAEKRTVTVASDSLNVRQTAKLNGPFTRGPVQAGETVSVLGWQNGDEVDGENRWWVTASFSRLWVGGTEEEPSPVTTPVPDPPAPTAPYVEIINGKRFYHVGSDGKGRTVTLARDAKAYEWADPSSAVKRTLKKGDKVKVTSWVESSKVVDGSVIWWVLEDGDYRLPLTATVEFPA